MKHNQFKRLMRKYLEVQCQKHSCYCQYVDINNNDRMFYIYDLNDAAKGSLSLYVNDKEFYLRYSSNSDSVVNIANYNKKWQGSYLKLKTAKEFIANALEDMNEEMLQKSKL